MDKLIIWDLFMEMDNNGLIIQVPSMKFTAVKFITLNLKFNRLRKFKQLNKLKRKSFHNLLFKEKSFLNQSSNNKLFRHLLSLSRKLKDLFTLNKSLEMLLLITKE